MKNKSLITVLLSIAITVSQACSSGNKIFVSNVKNAKDIPGNSFIYALPQTVLEITLTACETTFIPGPYRQFANKLLNIENVPDSEYTTWTLNDVSINAYIEADRDNVFVAQNVSWTDDSDVIKMLLDKGLVLGPDKFSGNRFFENEIPGLSNNQNFKRLSVTSNTKIETRTEVLRTYPEFTQSAPLTRTTEVEVQKTPEEKATDVANLILKIRRSKLKMVGGLNEYMPDAEALKIALKELDEAEEEYLSLFVGKKIQRFHKQYYIITPSKHRSVETVVLSAFSETYGLVDPAAENSSIIRVALTNDNKTQALDPVISLNKNMNKFVNYRIADQASIKITMGDKTLISKSLPVFQYGTIVPVSVDK